VQQQGPGKILVVITARGGSKGLPGKNIKPLCGKPLLHYTIDAARAIADDRDICLSSDSEEIIRSAIDYGLKVPFVRPAELASDIAGSYEVLLHAIDFYRQAGHQYETLVLLQPTSPFRTGRHIEKALELYTSAIDMVVSVNESVENPYYTLVEEDENGFVVKVKDAGFTRRQDCPKVYAYNGAIYIINIRVLLQKKMSAFSRVIKYTMSRTDSVDIDTPLDWAWAEFLIEKGFISISDAEH
jgi:CMP-N,N'-diacetyllegionaminic acid synthase